MLLSAMFLNPTDGPPPQLIVLGIGVIGSIVGILWIRRIASFGEDLDASFWRSHPRGGRGSILPVMGKPPTWRWIATRLLLVVALGTVFAAAAGPALLLRWERPLEEHLPIAAALWAIAVVAAIVGAAWMVRIALRDPDNGPTRWRYRR